MLFFYLALFCFTLVVVFFDSRYQYSTRQQEIMKRFITGQLQSLALHSRTNKRLLEKNATFSVNEQFSFLDDSYCFSESKPLPPV